MKKFTIALLSLFIVRFLSFGNVIDLGDKDFYEKTKNKVFFVDFYADWCGPCRAFAPNFDAVAKKLKDLNFARVNTDTAQKLSSDFKIQYIPYIVAVKNGKLIEQYKGNRSVEDFSKWCLKISESSEEKK